MLQPKTPNFLPSLKLHSQKRYEQLQSKVLRKPSQIEYLIVLGVVLLVFVVNASGYQRIREEQTRVLELAEHDAEATVALIEGVFWRTIHANRLILGGLAANLPRIDNFMELENPEVQQALNQEGLIFPFAQDVLLLNRAGLRVNAAQTDVSGPPISLADRDYFEVHSSGRMAYEYGNRDELYFTEPLDARVGDVWFVAVSKGLYTPRGEFTGVAVSLLVSNIISDFYTSVLGEWQGDISLWHSAGKLVARGPLEDASILGQDYSDSEFIKTLFGRERIATERVLSPVSNEQEIVSYHRVEGYPFVISAGIPVTTVLEPWRRYRNSFIIASIVRSLLVSLAAWFLWRYLVSKQRHDATVARAQGALDTTRQLQQMLLPNQQELEAAEGLDIAGFMRPAEDVGGDYYDVLPYEGGLRIGMGDVTGHGLESGLIMIMTQTVVRTLLESGIHDPKLQFDILNRTLAQNIKRMNSDKSLTLALLDYNSGNLKLSGQHESVLLMRADSNSCYIDTMDLGFFVGLENNNISRFVSQKDIDLAIGDGVVLYTDGITEAPNTQGELYGLERLRRVVEEHWQKPAKVIQDAVIADVTAYTGDASNDDDITLLVLKRQA